MSQTPSPKQVRPSSLELCSPVHIKVKGKENGLVFIDYKDLIPFYSSAIKLNYLTLFLQQFNLRLLIIVEDSDKEKMKSISSSFKRSGMNISLVEGFIHLDTFNKLAEESEPNSATMVLATKVEYDHLKINSFKLNKTKLLDVFEYNLLCKYWREINDPS